MYEYIQLYTEIAEYAELLAATYSKMDSIWLFGSRANGTERPGSDWDLLLFGNRQVLDCLRVHEALHRADFDCLVQINDSFKNAWGINKLLDLTDLAWQKGSPVQAMYTEKRWYDRKGVIRKRMNAIRVWPPATIIQPNKRLQCVGNSAVTAETHRSSTRKTD